MRLWKWAAAAAAVAILGVGALLGYTALATQGTDPKPPISGAPADRPAGMSRGEYLVRAADCAVCHTAKGGKPFAGGRPFRMPFGTIYSTNITADPASGIGKWSDEEFVAAVREGIGPHGRLYPAMPYTSYTGLSRADVLAMKAYLLSLPAVHKATPRDSLSFPFDQRWGMALWDAVFFHAHRFTAQPSKGAEWNRGAYLATALGHCGECHTPRNIGFAMKSRDYLAGTVIEGWKAYNTTSNASYGIGAWTDEQLTGFLWRGHAPGRSTASGPMGEVVQHSLQYFSPSDIRDLVRYLRSVEPQAGGQTATIDLDPKAALASSAVLPADSSAGGRGMRLFEADCTGCHQWNGVGRESRYQSLLGSHAVNDPTGHALVQVILHGTSLTIQGRSHVMPAFGSIYSDADVAALANYMLRHFGAKHGAVTAAQVDLERSQN